jgi:hypothetical protein
MARQQQRWPAEDETAFQRKVVELAKWMGITAWHDNDPLKNDAGFPDLVLFGKMRPGRRRAVKWRELKTDDRRSQPNPAQVKFGAMLVAAGEDYAIWRPADLRSGLIQLELEAIR